MTAQCFCVKIIERFWRRAAPAAPLEPPVVAPNPIVSQLIFYWKMMCTSPVFSNGKDKQRKETDVCFSSGSGLATCRMQSWPYHIRTIYKNTYVIRTCHISRYVGTFLILTCIFFYCFGQSF